MKKRFFPIMSVFVALIMLFQIFPLYGVFAQNSDASSNDEPESPIWYLRENFGASSSWDNAMVNNGTDYSQMKGTVGVSLVDGSSVQKSEAYRALNDITSGVITFDFDFSLDGYVDGVGFRLLNDTNTVFGIVTKGSGLYLEQPDGKTEYLHSYSNTIVNKDKLTYVVAHIDMDTKTILDVYIDGVKCAENKPLVTPAKINGFDAETQEESTVLLKMQRIYIYKNFIVNDDFYDAQRISALDWDFESDGGNLSVYSVNNRNADRYSMQINTNGGGVEATKSFKETSGRMIVEMSALQFEKRNGINISVNSGSKSVISVSADGRNFSYSNGSSNESFYDYLKNTWYKFKFDIDLDNSVADVYLNNKLKAKAVPIDSSVKSIDKIVINADKNDNPLVIDDVKVYRPYNLDREDYVPAPVKPEKDNDFVIGMQMCPLWTEGLYTHAWDYVKAAPDRMPLLGAYDEGNPEVNDWNIKWLVDHGFDFQWICSYTSYPLAQAAKHSPIKPDMDREGNALYEGFMSSKYSNDFKFAIMMENSYLSSGKVLNSYFFDNVVPYWIEYYFKDDRYLKIDGRPIVGIYLADYFAKMFDGIDGLTGTEAYKAGVEKFKQMCVDAGVGEPYMVSQIGAVGYTEKNYAAYSSYGFDGMNAYGYKQKEGPLDQINVLTAGLENSKKYNIDTVPAVVPRRGDDPWLNGQNEVGYKSTVEEFEKELNWVKDTFAPGKTSRLSKQLVMAGTWDELGEGHILCPTVGDKFKYLDSFRKVFCTDYEHEEAIPTEAQKKRVNYLVVQNRKTGDLTDVNIRSYYRENPAREVPENVKYEWVFDENAANNEWAAKTGIGENSISDEGWVITPDNSNPTIGFKGKAAYDICDVTYVKIRMKQNLTSTGGYLTYKTSANVEWNDMEQASRLSPSVDGKYEFKDYYIPVGENAHWRGNVTGLNILLGTVSDLNQPFVIQSISFLSDPEYTEMPKVSVKGANYLLHTDPIVNGDVVMLPLREVCDIYDVRLQKYGIDNAYIFSSNGGTGLIQEGNITAKLNNKDVKLDAIPYRVSEIVNDTVYVPMSFISQVFGKEMTYDASTKIVTIADAFPFTDMEDCAWAKEDVFKLYELGVINGEGGTTFNPDREITREEFLKILVEGFLNDSTSSQVNFSDVDDSEWYAKYIATAVDFGIVNGKDDGTFGVGEFITRQDMAVMLYRTLAKLASVEKTDIQEIQKFKDSDEISDYALDAVGFMAQNGIVLGMEDGMFMPFANATRAQSAVIICRAMEFLKSLK